MSVVRPLRSAALLFSLLFALGTGTCLAAGEQQVGVSAAVNPEATGTPPGGSAKTLVLGQNVVFNERIQTAAAGQTQLLFVDQSAMTVGPNSDLTIDKFVYNPDSGTGNMTVSAAKGVLRFVGGKLSKQENGVDVKTPQATIAVRGGAFLMTVQPGGKLDVFFIYGHAVTVTGTNGVTQTMTRPGFAITVSAPGASPSPPAPAPPGAINAVLVQVDGRSGASGGAAQAPTELTVTNAANSSGVSNTISGDVTASVQSAVQNQATNSTVMVSNGGTAGNSLSSQTSTNITPPLVPIDCTVTGACAGSSSQTFFASTTTPPPTTTPPTTTPPTTTPPTVIQFAGNFRSTNGQGTARGFVDPNGIVSYAGGTLSFPPGSPQQGMFTATLQTSQGPVTLQFPLVPGNATLNPSQTQSALGPFGGTTFLAPDNSYFYANLQPTNFPTEKGFVFGGTAISSSTVLNPVTAYKVQPDAALQSAIPFIRNNAGGALPNAAVSPLYVVAPASTTLGQAASSGNARTLQASLAINGNGANQQSAIAANFGTFGTTASGAPAINGVVRGSSRLSAGVNPTGIQSTANSVVDGNGNSVYGTNAISGFTLGTTSASETPLNGSTTTYGFAQPVTAAAVPSGVGTSRTTQTQAGWFGGTLNSTATSPYTIAGTTSITTNASTNGVTATFSGSPSAAGGYSNLTMQFGGPGAPQAFVDNNNFGAAESVSTNSQVVTLNGSTVTATGPLYMVTSATAPAPQSLLPAGASYCACQYLQWGYWGGTLTSPNGAANPRVDQGHINFWVAGQPTSAADIASLQNASLANAQASYVGHAIGSVANNGQQYVAAGGFNQSYNFASQQMNTSITNFDGRNFSGVTAVGGRTPVTVTATGNSYTLPVNNTPGFGGTFNGSFYGPQAANTGGNFAVQSTAGPSYAAAGIFAGHR